MSNRHGIPDDGPGCYIDGHWGQYGPDRMAEIADALLGTRWSHDGPAASYYAEITELRQAAEDESLSPDESCSLWEQYHDLSDEIEQALNDAAPDGYYWSWIDGEFFYCDASEDEDEES